MGLKERIDKVERTMGPEPTEGLRTALLFDDGDGTTWHEGPDGERRDVSVDDLRAHNPHLATLFVYRRRRGAGADDRVLPA